MNEHHLVAPYHITCSAQSKLIHFGIVKSSTCDNFPCICVCVHVYIINIKSSPGFSCFHVLVQQCSLSLHTHCITDSSTLNSSSQFWLQFTTSITKHQSYLWILLPLSVKFSLQCLRSDNSNQPSWFYGNWEGSYTEKSLTNETLKYSNFDPKGMYEFLLFWWKRDRYWFWPGVLLQCSFLCLLQLFLWCFSLKKENERMSPVTSGQYRSCPNGHCTTGSYRALVFLLTAKLNIRKKEAAGVPHIAWGEMCLSFYLLTFCNCCRDF